MSIHQNSREAFQSVDKEKAQSKVLAMLREKGKATRQDLAAWLGWEINRVTPRVRELLNLERIYESGTVYAETNGVRRPRAVLEIKEQ